MGVLVKYSSNHMHPHKYVWKNSKRATFEIWNLNVELVLDYIAPFTAVTKLVRNFLTSDDQWRPPQVRQDTTPRVGIDIFCSCIIRLESDRREWSPGPSLIRNVTPTTPNICRRCLVGAFKVDARTGSVAVKQLPKSGFENVYIPGRKIVTISGRSWFNPHFRFMFICYKFNLRSQRCSVFFRWVSGELFCVPHLQKFISDWQW